MNWIIDNWSLLVVLVAIIGCIVVYFMRLSQKSFDENLNNFKSWLLYAVTMAEKEFGGGGTGILKLRYCYQLAAEKFPWIIKVITFERFAMLVDEALEEMRHLLETNTKIKDIVENK